MQYRLVFLLGYPQGPDSLNDEWVFLQKVRQHQLYDLLKRHLLNLWIPIKCLSPARVNHSPQSSINNASLLPFILTDSLAGPGPAVSDELIEQPLGSVRVNHERFQKVILFSDSWTHHRSRFA